MKERRAKNPKGPFGPPEEDGTGGFLDMRNRIGLTRKDKTMFTYFGRLGEVARRAEDARQKAEAERNN